MAIAFYEILLCKISLLFDVIGDFMVWEAGVIIAQGSSFWNNLKSRNGL